MQFILNAIFLACHFVILHLKTTLKKYSKTSKKKKCKHQFAILYITLSALYEEVF